MHRVLHVSVFKPSQKTRCLKSRLPAEAMPGNRNSLPDVLQSHLSSDLEQTAFFGGTPAQSSQRRPPSPGGLAKKRDGKSPKRDVCFADAVGKDMLQQDSSGLDSGPSPEPAVATMPTVEMLPAEPMRNGEHRYERTKMQLGMESGSDAQLYMVPIPTVSSTDSWEHRVEQTKRQLAMESGPDPEPDVATMPTAEMLKWVISPIDDEPTTNSEQKIQWNKMQPVEIYSKGKGMWVAGTVYEVKGDHVNVEYRVDGRYLTKWLLDSSPHLRAKPASAPAAPAAPPVRAPPPPSPGLQFVSPRGADLAHRVREHILGKSIRLPQTPVNSGYSTYEMQVGQVVAEMPPVYQSSTFPEPERESSQGGLSPFSSPALSNVSYLLPQRDPAASAVSSGSYAAGPELGKRRKSGSSRTCSLGGFFDIIDEPEFLELPPQPVVDKKQIVPNANDIHSSPHAGKVGLRNVGNTCFMNTGLQCLSHIEPLAAYFVSGRYLKDVNRTSTKGYGGEMADTFAELQRLLWQKSPPDSTELPDGISDFLTGLRALFWESEQQSSGPPEGGVAFARSLRTKLSRFAPYLFEGHQEDVQEFLAFCLDALHEDLNRVRGKPPPFTEQQEKQDAELSARNGDEFAAALAWMRYLERGKSYLVDLLQGQLRSSLTCLRCGHCSQRFEAFLYLSVPVDLKMTFITDALARHLEAETLAGDEQWYCERCCKKVDARKKIDLWKLPPVLILHLKRFEFNAKSLQTCKVKTKLLAPDGVLDLSGSLGT